VSLRFPYQAVPLQGPPPLTLAINATERWRPLVPVRLVSLTTGQFRDFDQALLDSGADDAIFPLAAALAIGVSFLPEVGTAVTIRWGGSTHPVRYGEVRLELTDGTTTWSWPARVAFSAAPIRYPLLGQAGCLQYLDATFLGADRVAMLDLNPSYPGITA
jgi:hypothetical protein